MQNGVMTIDCPTCGEPATVTITPVNDGRLARSREQFLCPNGHTGPAKLTPPRDDRLTR